KINLLFLKILTVSLVTLSSSQVDAGRLTKTFDFLKTDLVFEKEKGYDKVTLKDAFHTTEFGKPLLPSRVFYFVIPANAEVSDVRAISIKSAILEGEYDLFPTQPPKSIKGDPVWVEPDAKVYGSPAPYPENLAKLTGEGYLAGYKIVSILVYPLQYSPAEKKLTFHSKIEIVLEYRSSFNTSIPVKRKSRENQELFRNMVTGLVVNPFDVEIFTPSPQTVKTSKVDKFSITEMPSAQGTSVEYVIITSDDLAGEFQALADWKTKRGIPATVRTTSWIQANYPNGADLQETIRKFVQDAYTHWGTVWVLLGGDTDIIPPRYAHVNQAFYYGENIPTDIYYACLDGNWNADGDGIFGEAVWDSVDLYPEIFIGRAPVEDTSEANTFVNKVMNYANPDSTAYQTKALFLGTDMFTSGDGADFCDVIADSIFPSWFIKAKLYEPPGREGDENRQAVIDSLNAGFNLVYFQGHGSGDGIQVKRDFAGNRAHQEHLNRADMDTLTNDGKFSIFYAVTCNAGSIDHDAFFEHFLNNPNGGGVGAVSTTRYDYPFVEFKFSKTFFDSLFSSSENNVKIGKTEEMSRIPFIGNSEIDGQHRFIQFTRILLADPEMDVWTDNPKCLTASFPDSVPLGPTQFTVTVQTCIPTASSLISGALVTLKKGDEDYAYGLTDNNGQITFTFTPETAGSLSVAVTKHNYLPFEGYSQIYVPEPYVVYHNQTIDDDDVGGSSGNDNGIIDAGESIEMPFVLKNTGSGTALNVEATLTTSNSYVTITDSLETFGNISPGDTAVSLEDFYFLISTNPPDDEDLTFTVSITYSSDGQPSLSSTDEFTLKIRAPNLEHFAHTVADQYDDALANFDAALTMRSDYQTGHFNRGNLLLATGRWR
ncbi:hypothetical protein IIA15_11005, partial [candidate division TA06 bacterium]|nr:hypothetical protein [candidate division TA06 bacterium]